MYSTKFEPALRSAIGKHSISALLLHRSYRVTRDDCEVSRNMIVVLDNEHVLGRGAYGQVYSGKLYRVRRKTFLTGTVQALKVAIKMPSCAFPHYLR